VRRRLCICQQLAALSISTALVRKLLVIAQLLHPALKFAVSAPWPAFQLCPFSQQILATPLTADARYLCGSWAFRYDIHKHRLTRFNANVYSVSKKVAPLKLFAIFSLMVNLCNWKLSFLLPKHIPTFTPILV